MPSIAPPVTLSIPVPARRRRHADRRAGLRRMWLVRAARPPRHQDTPAASSATHWQDKSSRDPKQIAAWFAGTDHEHRAALRAVRCRRARRRQARPGARRLVAAPRHRAVPVDPPRRSGPWALRVRDAAGPHHRQWPGVLGWGEVRGHERRHQGRSRVARRRRPIPLGAHMIPVLPDEIAEKLDDATPASDAASDAEVNAFLAEHTEASRPEILAGWMKALGNHFAAHASRHGSTVPVLVGAMKEARAGYFPAQDAVDTIRPMFLEEVAKPPASSTRTPRAPARWPHRVLRHPRVGGRAGQRRRPRRGTCTRRRADARQRPRRRHDSFRRRRPGHR